MGWFIPLVKRFAVAIGSGTKTEKRRTVLRTAAVFSAMIGDFKADSIERIEEALVQEAEAESKQAGAEAELKVAEAAEIQAKTDLKRAEARKVYAEAEGLLIDNETKRMKAIADACERFASASSKIRRAGGSVAFMEIELAKLLQQGKKEFPKDRLIQNGPDKVETAGDESSAR